MHGVAREQAGADHDRRVRGVGAGGDRGDHHIAMAEIEIGALDRIARWRSSSALLELIGHAPWRSPAPASSRRRRGPAGASARRSRARPSARSSVERVGEDRLRRLGRPEHALRLGIGLDQRDLRGGRAGAFEIGERLGADREEAAGRAIFGRHVGDRRHVLEREAGKARPVEFDELADHALLAQHLRDGEHEIGGGRAFGAACRSSLKPITSGISIEIGWPSMAASASMPPTPQPSTARPLTMVVWLSVPTSVSG